MKKIFLALLTITTGSCSAMQEAKKYAAQFLEDALHIIVTRPKESAFARKDIAIMARGSYANTLSQDKQLAEHFMEIALRAENILCLNNYRDLYTQLREKLSEACMTEQKELLSAVSDRAAAAYNARIQDSPEEAKRFEIIKAQADYIVDRYQ